MMGRPKIPARLCAICVKSAATEATEIDGRIYQVCAGCGGGEVVPVSRGVDEHRDSLGRRSRAEDVRKAIVQVVAHADSITAKEVGDLLGVAEARGRHDRARQRLYRLIKQLAIEGHLRSEKRSGLRMYSLARKEAA